MQHIIPRLIHGLTVIGLFALMSACTQGEPGSVNPASIGNGASITNADRRALKPAPTPALETVGAPSAPSFGPGVGGGINSGIGIQRDNMLVP